MAKQTVAHNKTWLNYKDYEPTYNRVVIIAQVNSSGQTYDTYGIEYNDIVDEGLDIYWIDLPMIDKYTNE